MVKIQTKTDELLSTNRNDKKYNIKVVLHSNKKIMVVLKLKFRCFLEEVI